MRHTPHRDLEMIVIVNINKKTEKFLTKYFSFFFSVNRLHISNLCCFDSSDFHPEAERRRKWKEKRKTKNEKEKLVYAIKSCSYLLNNK